MNKVYMVRTTGKKDKKKVKSYMIFGTKKEADLVKSKMEEVGEKAKKKGWKNVRITEFKRSA